MKKQTLLIIIFFLAQGIIHNLGHPVTPAFVRGLGIPDFMFGVFFASMSLGLMIGAPMWGILSDRGKKKAFIIIGLLLYSLGQFFFAYSNNSILMVFFRFLSGFGVVSSMTLLTSEMIEISDVKSRAKHLAYLAAAFTLGASLGYGVGGFLSTNEVMRNMLGTSDYRMIFLIQCGLNTLFTLFVFVWFKEMNGNVEPLVKPSFIEGLKSITKIEPSLLIFMISLTFMTIGAINLSKYIDVYFDELGYNPQQLGTFVMATGFVSLLSSIFLVPFFAKAKKQLLAIALIHIISAMIVFYVFRSTVFLISAYTVYMVYVAFKAIYQPLEQNYISSHASNNKYGSIMGLRQSFVSIGMVIGPLLGGFIYEVNPILLFDVSGFAFLLGVALLFVVFTLKKAQQKSNQS
ncbi:MAG: MFS transporter [Acholeplasmataceae bacterium]|nr:MFS transporter [Acholeplasmataceae bacterium]